MIVKICGITQAQDALAARYAGADLLGFVFAPSPRRVTPEQVREIVECLKEKKNELQIVGVFVNEKPDAVRRVIGEVGLDLVQLHGNESPDYCRSMPVPVIKAFRVKDKRSLAAVEPYLGAVRSLLLDSYRSSMVGGTGETFDWSFAKGIAAYGVPWLLAGGLNPQNVAAAVACCRPDGVDVSGGVESSPGVKDHRLIQEFIIKAKGVHGV